MGRQAGGQGRADDVVALGRAQPDQSRPESPVQVGRGAGNRLCQAVGGERADPEALRLQVPVEGVETGWAGTEAVRELGDRQKVVVLSAAW